MSFASIYSLASQFSVFMGFLNVQTSESLHLYLSCASLGALFLLLILSYSDILIFVFTYYILVLLFSPKACVFSNEKQEGGGSRWMGRWGGTWSMRGRETVIRIYYVRKGKLFSIKGVKTTKKEK